MNVTLADEIEKRIKALSEEPDSSKGGILLPWKMQAEGELARFLNDQACNIVDALRARPEAVECLRDILDCPQEDDPNGYVQYTVPAELVKKAIAALAEQSKPQPSVQGDKNVG